MALVSELRGDLCIVTNALQKIRKEDALPVHEEEAADVQQQLLAQQLESLSRRNSDTQLSEIYHLQQRASTHIFPEKSQLKPKIVISCDSIESAATKQSKRTYLNEPISAQVNESQSLTKSESSPCVVYDSVSFQNKTKSIENLCANFIENKSRFDFDINHNIELQQIKTDKPHKTEAENGTKIGCLKKLQSET